MDLSILKEYLDNSVTDDNYELLSEASEGDAYRYMKKVLASLPCASELEQHYGENWTREIFNIIRNDFVHSGCDVYFVPGLARILFGELNYDSENEDSLKVRQLHTIVEYITNNYKEHFTRNLALIGKDKTISEPYTFKQLYTVFGKALADLAESLKLDLPVIDKYAYSNIVITEGSSLEVVDGKENNIGEHFKKYMKKKKAEEPKKKKTCCGC